MNYIIDNSIDFYKEINLIEETNSDNNICLLSGEPLKENNITLNCNHKFNYLPLYYEICQQKKYKYNSLEVTRLSINQIKCPYCRNITNKLLPFIIDENVELKNGINSPSKYCLQINTCDWIFKNGKNKANKCNCSSFIFNEKNLCLKHHKISNKTNNESINSNYDSEFINKIKKKYTVIDIKKILKDNNLKISGKKEKLILRIINNKITLNI